MVDGAERRAWTHTSHVLAMLHNVNCGKGQGKPPADFNPVLAAERREANRLTPQKLLDVIKPMFVKQG